MENFDVLLTALCFFLLFDAVYSYRKISKFVLLLNLSFSCWWYPSWQYHYVEWSVSALYQMTFSYSRKKSGQVLLIQLLQDESCKALSLCSCIWLLLSISIILHDSLRKNNGVHKNNDYRFYRFVDVDECILYYTTMLSYACKKAVKYYSYKLYKMRATKPYRFPPRFMCFLSCLFFHVIYQGKQWSK